MKRIFSLLISVLLLFLVISPIHATEQISAESFQAMTPYGVPEAHDTSTTQRKKPAIFWGYESDGSVTFSAGTYQSAFNSSCTPFIFITPILNEDTGNTGYEVHIKSVTDTSFTYEVRKNVNGTVTDITTSQTIQWVAFGWK